MDNGIVDYGGGEFDEISVANLIANEAIEELKECNLVAMEHVLPRIFAAATEIILKNLRKKQLICPATKKVMTCAKECPGEDKCKENNME